MLMRKILLFAFMASFASALYAQQPLSDNERKYIVMTKQPVKETKSADEQQGDSLAQTSIPEPVDSMQIWFPFVSMCDWTPGMRFMVVPDKKDLVIKTFAEASTGNMVSSVSLRHKVMIYDGHDDANGGLHEHVNFTCEETGMKYYFEVPTHKFDDYCYNNMGVSSLVYLGDVDVAKEKLMGKSLITKANVYYVDNPASAEGYEPLYNIPKGTEVKVVAVGAGTRSFPVKLIVKEVTKDDNGREFFQNVTISHTNCGMRDDEFKREEMKIHTFNGSFELDEDDAVIGGLYERFNHKNVYTLISMDMVDEASNKKVHFNRLSSFYVRKIRPQKGSEYAKMTLTEKGSGKKYTVEALFVNKNLIGVYDSQKNKYVGNMFAVGDPKSMDGVRETNWQDVQNGVVRRGFTEAEVRMAIGEPSNTGRKGNQTVWLYKQPGSPVRTVIFNSSTHKVASISDR